jgi:type II secretory pathway pseudopilin PulG
VTTTGSLCSRLAALSRGHGTDAADAGVSLVELTVVLSIMSVVMGLFGAGIVQVHSSARSSEAMSIAAAQLHNAFLRLDRDIRYASGISVPGQVGSTWYVEYQVTNTGHDDCTQLRILAGSGQLQSRTSRDDGVVGDWTVLASSVTSPQQFSRTAATSSGAQHQQLGVALTVQSGSGSSLRRRQAGFTFTALNTSIDTESDDVCNGLARI